MTKSNLAVAAASGVLGSSAIGAGIGVPLDNYVKNGKVLSANSVDNLGLENSGNYMVIDKNWEEIDLETIDFKNFDSFKDFVFKYDFWITGDWFGRNSKTYFYKFINFPPYDEREFYTIRKPHTDPHFAKHSEFDTVVKVVVPWPLCVAKIKSKEWHGAVDWLLKNCFMKPITD